VLAANRWKRRNRSIRRSWILRRAGATPGGGGVADLIHHVQAIPRTKFARPVLEL
jgi:hypothetical protein